MVIPEIDSLIAENSKSEERQTQTHKKLADAMKRVVDGVWNTFEANAEFKAYLLKCFNQGTRIFEKEGDELILERMLKADLPMLIGEIPPYDRETDIARFNLGYQRRMIQVRNLIGARLREDRLKLKFRSSVDWARIESDRDLRQSEKPKGLEEDFLTSYATYTLDSDHGKLILLTPYFNSAKNANDDQGIAGFILNGLLGQAIHRVMAHGKLVRGEKNSSQFKRKPTLPLAIPFRYDDLWVGKYAQFELDIGDLEKLYKFTNGDRGDYYPKMAHRICQASLRLLSRDVNEEVSSSLGFAGLGHQVQLLPERYLESITSWLKEQSSV